MKNIVSFLALALLMSLPAFAQEQKKDDVWDVALAKDAKDDDDNGVVTSSIESVEPAEEEPADEPKESVVDDFDNSIDASKDDDDIDADID